MSKFQIFHTERNASAGLPYDPAQSMDTRIEGAPDGYETKQEAESVMREMQSQARANGYDEYADALHVEAIGE